jgi:capsid assembly protease
MKGTMESPGTWLAEIESHLWAMRTEQLGTLLRLAADGELGAHYRLTDYHATIRDESHQALQVALQLADGKPLSAEQIEAARTRGRPRSIQGGVQRVPLKGVLAPMTGFLAMFFGDYNPLDTFLSGMRDAMADDEVGAIIVDIDSPGGVVDGIPEAAAALRGMRGPKPIIASVNTLCASAAYWIASQADEISITPSGAAGSIGVYATHRDMSGMMEMMGVNTTLISAGKYKTEGNPFEPLTDEAKAAIQSDVDDFYGMFVADVAKGRGASVKDVRSGYGEGRVLNAKRSVDAKLVDRIETIDQTAARLSSRSRGGVTRAEADAGATQLEEAEAQAGAAVDAERDKGHALLGLFDDRFKDDLAAAAAS